MSNKQQLVLEWLKGEVRQGVYPTVAIGWLDERITDDIYEAYEDITAKEEFEVLKAFAEWGLENA